MKFERQETYAVATTALSPFEAETCPVITPPALGGVTKRVLDIVLIVLSLPILAPLMVGVILLIMATTKGPIFYGHKRIGHGGQYFKCWKFRTMVQNGDETLARYLEENAQENTLWQTHRKLKCDPRVTPLGRVLRKLSIDELPQLFNILIGEMSIVGPRPVTADELDFYGSSLDHYLSCRPGLTGLWQVSGRSNTTYRYRVALDRLYVTRWNFVLDLWIILKTVPAVLSSHGAV